jgi:hypothetical protein
MEDLPGRGEIPKSAIVEGKGKRSFLRPLLLGGRKNKGKEMPTAMKHNLKQEIRQPTYDGYGGIVKDSLHVEAKEVPESLYEETAFISDEVSEWAPSMSKAQEKDRKGVSKQIDEPRVEPGFKTLSSSSLVVIDTPITGITPVTPMTSKVEPIDSSPPISPVLCPTPSTPIQFDIPITPVPSTPITPLSPITMPPSPPTPDPMSNTLIDQESPSPLGSPISEHTPDPEPRRVRELKNEERGILEPSGREREREREREKSRSSRKVVENTWLEMILEDLPFGPDKNMVSTLLFNSPHSPSLERDGADHSVPSFGIDEEGLQTPFSGDYCSCRLSICNSTIRLVIRLVVVVVYAC